MHTKLPSGQPKKPWFQRWFDKAADPRINAAGMLFINAVLMLAAVSAALDARRTATISLQETKSERAAVLFPNMLEARRGVHVGFVNRGKVIASDLHAEFTVRHETFPERRLIGTEQTFKFDKGQVRADEEAGMIFYVAGLPDKIWQTIQTTGKETVTVTGTYNYRNGFGDTVREKFCMCNWYLVRQGSRSGGWAPCDAADDSYRASLPPVD